LFSLLRRLCTILGFAVLLLVVLFYSQHYWLNRAIGYLVSDLTEYRWRADSVEWMPTWPMVLEIKQLQLRYREGVTPEDFIRAQRLQLTLGAIPWSEGRLQIRHLDAQVETVNWIRFPAVPLSAARLEQEKKTPFYKGVAVQTIQLEVMGVAYFDRVREPAPPPQLYVLNLKTPLIRGPIQSWEQLENVLLPGFSKSKRGPK
jgi:hypothetical protein